MRFRFILASVLLAAFISSAEDTAIRSKDIGNPQPAGSTTPVGDDGYDVSASGKDIWWDGDNFRFVYCQLDGDFDIRVRVQELKFVHEWTKAGLMARVSLLPDAAHVGVIFNGGGITQVLQRASKGEQTTGHQQSASFQGVTLRLIRKNGALTAYRTTTLDASKFEKISDALALPPGPLFVGMCLCGHQEPDVASAKFRDFTMSALSAGKDPLAGLATAPSTLITSEGSAPKSDAAPVAAAAPEETPAAPRPRAASKAVDAQTATALALAGAKMAEAGKTEQAREYYFKSLANDPNCGDALYELGKLFEKEGQLTAAGNFLALASRELLRVETELLGAATKRKDADRRILALNPAAAQMRVAMQEYSDDLAAITRKEKDALTHDEVAERIQNMELERYVASDKLPKTPNRTVAAVSRPNNSGSSSTSSSSSFRNNSSVAVSPDIEKAMKAAGWQSVSGTWKEVSKNVYEVTDGKLESKYKNGFMQAVIVNTPNSKGTVRMMVRNGHREYGSSSFSSSTYTYRTGYGLTIDSSTATQMIPYGLTGSRFVPIDDKAFKLDSPTRNQFLISVTTNALEYSINGKRMHRSNYTISDEGPFTIELHGTVTIENPQVKGN